MADIRSSLVLGLFILVMLHSSDSEPILTLLKHDCPIECECDSVSYSVTCIYNGEAMKTTQILKDYFSVHHVSSLSIHKGLFDLQLLNNVPTDGVQTLNLSDNSLRTINRASFSAGFDNVRVLDLSENYVDTIEESAFSGGVSNSLQALNLSFNMLNNIPGLAFKHLDNLQFLDLSNNRIESLSSSLFNDLRNLISLDLSFNQLSYLSSKYFTNLQNLQRLYLHNNIFRTFHPDVIPVLSNLRSIDISFNPFECSCAIKPLVEFVKQISSIARTALSSDVISSVASMDDAACESPDFYQGRLLKDVDVDNLNCSHPIIVNISSERSVLYKADLYLSCRVIGYPNPSVIWLTPWGENFSHHTSHHLIGDEALDHSVESSYNGHKVLYSTGITAYANGSLHITNFRGFFAGNFTCFAITPMGNVSAEVVVNIYSPFHEIYIQSLIYGGMSAAGFLTFGIIMAIIITIIRRICCRDFFMTEEKIKIPEIIIVVPSDDEISSCHTDDDYDHDHFDSAPDTPLTCRNSPDVSDSWKIFTPTSESPPQGWLSSNMIETIEEVRSKLKYGVERKMETVRTHTKAIKDSSVKKIETVRTHVKTMKDTGEKKMETIRTNVKSMKDSGTVYMQSIKDTSSQAANKVRAGVVLSVETMKYTVQSMKELCGTGEMGGQTISMVSVETDIDSNQSHQVIKSITYV